MNITVYTCVTGGYDNLRPPLVARETGVRYICFTDVPQMPDTPPWEFRPVHRVSDASGYSARRTACLPKILPHLVLPDCDFSIWHDGNFRLAAYASCVTAAAGVADLALHRHPSRDCVYKEADALIEGKFGTARLIREETSFYRAIGHPESFGLWACGMIVRRHTTATAALNEAWWNLYANGCELDQMAFAVAARNTLNTRIADLPGDVFASPFMRFDGWHAKWCDAADKDAARPARAGVAARVDKLRDLAGDGGYTWETY